METVKWFGMLGFGFVIASMTQVLAFGDTDTALVFAVIAVACALLEIERK